MEKLHGIFPSMILFFLYIFFLLFTFTCLRDFPTLTVLFSETLQKAMISFSLWLSVYNLFFIVFFFSTLFSYQFNDSGPNCNWTWMFWFPREIVLQIQREWFKIWQWRKHSHFYTLQCTSLSLIWTKNIQNLIIIIIINKAIPSFMFNSNFSK